MAVKPILKMYIACENDFKIIFEKIKYENWSKKKTKIKVEP